MMTTNSKAFIETRFSAPELEVTHALSVFDCTSFGQVSDHQNNSSGEKPPPASREESPHASYDYLRGIKCPILVPQKYLSGLLNIVWSNRSSARSSFVRYTRTLHDHILLDIWLE